MCVFCPSPFTKKRKPQPSPVGVIFRGHHERAGWSVADAVRAMERNAGQKNTGTENEAADTKKRQAAAGHCALCAVDKAALQPIEVKRGN